MFSRSTCSAETNAIISSRELRTFFVNASNWTSANGANRIRNLPVEVVSHTRTHSNMFNIGFNWTLVYLSYKTRHTSTFYLVFLACDVSFTNLSMYFTPQSCDMWSLGVVIYIMLCGYPPFYSEVPRKQLSQGMKRRIMAGEYDYPEKEWSKISPEAKEVIARYVTLTIWIEP